LRDEIKRRVEKMIRDCNKERRRDRKKKKKYKEERHKWAMSYMLSLNVKWAVLCGVKTKQLS